MYSHKLGLVWKMNYSTEKRKQNYIDKGKAARWKQLNESACLCGYP